MAADISPANVQLNAIERKNLLKKAEELFKSTHFSREETERLLCTYRAITSDKIDRVQFRDLLHDHFGMSDDFFMDRVFRAFDKDSDGFLLPEEWVQGMSIFLRGTLEELIQYSFNIYDLNGDGYISREEIFQMLKSCFVKQPTEEDPEEGVKDLVEMVAKKMDHDSDTRLSYEDWKTSILNEHLFIEAFGPCLPKREDVEAFCHLVLT